MKFEVGGKVIAVKSHSQGAFKNGQVFELISIYKMQCGCHSLFFNIGIPHDIKKARLCSMCNKEYEINSEAWFFSSTLFLPYDDSISDLQSEELIEIMEQSKNINNGK